MAIEINVEEKFHTEERNVLLRVSGAEPMAAAYSRNGATFQPAQVTLRWVKDKNGDWTLGRVRVVGGLIKKSGSVSEATRRERIWYTVQQLEHSAPDWVQEIVAEYTPKEEK